MSASIAPPSDISRITNPFSTRWVRPGAMPFLFPPDTDAAVLVTQLRRHDWRASIVGPHGSGKSALLAALTVEIERSGRTIKSITLHDGQRGLPTDFVWPNPADPAGVIVVDGYEQLGWWALRQLNRCSRRSGWGLLLTAHSQPAVREFPVLFQTANSLATVVRLIDRHLPSHGGLIQHDDIAAAFIAQRGNVRETFFALYDLFEHRRRRAMCSE